MDFQSDIVSIVRVACVFDSYMPVERQWAADHCQSGTRRGIH